MEHECNIPFISMTGGFPSGRVVYFQDEQMRGSCSSMSPFIRLNTSISHQQIQKQNLNKHVKKETGAGLVM